MNKLTVIVLLIFTFLLAAQSSNAQKRIRFQKGASSTVIRGKTDCDRIIGSDGRSYVIGARVGQVMTLSNGPGEIVDRDGNSTYLEKNTRYVFPYTGDVKINIVNHCAGREPFSAPTPYTIRISIR